jgi:hypothetical protein
VSEEFINTYKIVKEDKERGIKIISADVGKSGITAAVESAKRTNQVLLVDEYDPNIVTVKGRQYRYHPPKRIPNSVSMIASLLGMMDPFSLPDLDPTKMKSDPLPTNIVAEYNLILDKKSKLTSSKRQYVVNQFNKLFKEVLTLK